MEYWSVAQKLSSLFHNSITPTLHFFSPCRLQFDHIMRLAFALARRTDADKSGLLPQLGQVGGPEVTHARLDPANELGQDPVHRIGHFLQCLDSFRRHLSRRVGAVA